MTAGGDGRSPLVSVVIPAYNAAETLDATLRSVRSQTETDLEVLVVDDGSTDTTATVIDAHTEVDPRVRRLDYGGKRGRSAARNSAIDEAAGEWVAFLDADDLWPADRLERLLDGAQRHRSTKVVFDDRIAFAVDPAGRVTLDDRFVSRSTWRLGEAEFVKRRGWLADKFCHMDPMIRRSFLADGGPRYPLGLSMAEDLCFCMQVAYWPEPTSPVRVGRPGYYYRLAPSTRASSGVWSLRRAVDLAAEVTGSTELRAVTDAYWPGLAWRFSLADRQFAAEGRLGPADPGVEGDHLGDVAWRGYVSMIREKALHQLARLADRGVRAAVIDDITAQLGRQGTALPGTGAVSPG